MKFQRIILASRSPRRVSLLQQAGFTGDRLIQVDPPFIDPPQPDHADPEATALRLARQKADSAIPLIDWPTHAGALLIAADTIVVAHDGSLLGQPATESDARRMLLKIIGQEHQVITAVHLVSQPSHPDHPGDMVRDAFADRATVRIGAVNNLELDRYLTSGDWQGKAGAYNLAELERTWPMSVQGDPATVVGLPMVRLLAYLNLHP